MRYLSSENPYIWVRFNTGDTVNISIYKASDDSLVVNNASMSELSSTGYFKYLFNPTDPTEITEYFYIASTDDEEQAGTVTLGGYPDEILEDTNRIAYLTSGSAATNIVPNGCVVTTGTETNDYTDVAKLDGVLHTITNVGGNIDFYYTFDLGANGVPVVIEWEGFANNNNDNFTIYAYNWVNSEWDEIGNFIGVNGSNIITTFFSLTIAHVGTSADQGKVHTRCTSSNGASISADRLLCSYATVYQSVGYASGAIWVDTNITNENTVSYIDGVADNPVSTVNAALTLSTQLNIKSFMVNNGSDVTLCCTCDNFTVNGYEWNLDLSGQSCAHASFSGARVVGVCTGNDTVFRDCSLASETHSMSADDMGAYNCALSGDIIITSAAGFYLDNCFSSMSGLNIPSIDFGGVVGNTSLKIRHYSGGIEIKNMGVSGTDNLSLEGDGQLIINANCTGGTITIRGNFTIVDNVSGGFQGTIIDDARFDQTQIADAIETSVIEGSLTQIELQRIILSAVSGLCSGGSSTNIKFRDLADTKDRIDATVDLVGNRSSVTLDGS